MGSTLVWKRIWEAKLPTKIKHFGWRVVHNGVAVRDNLDRKGLTDDVIYPMCGDEPETTIHTLCECEETKQLWYMSPLRIVVQKGKNKSMKEWCENLAHVIKDECWWDLFWCIMWGVWLRRNKWVFEQKKIQVEEVLSKAVSLVGEFIVASETNNQKTQAKEKALIRWKPPEEGYFKVNSDAALFDDGTVGCGAVMRDELGEVMDATAVVYDGRLEIDEAEAYAARHALQIAIEAGLRNLILETDCLKLVNYLKNGVVEASSFGNLVGDILECGKVCSSLSFAYVGRNGNKVAHKLAHVSRSIRSLRVWIEEVPQDVSPLVEADLVSIE